MTLRPGSLLLPLLLLASSTLPAADEADASRLVVASYNIRSGAGTWNLKIGPIKLPHVPWRRHKHLDRIVDTLEEAGADLVGLQETQGRNLRSGLVDQPKYLGDELHLFHVSSDVQRSLGGAVDRTGIAALSRWEILEHRAFRIDGPGQESMQRKAELLRVAHPAFPDGLWFLNTHMQGGSANPPQMEEILAALEEIEGPVIMTGDLNVTPDSPGVKKLLGRTDWSHRFQDAVELGGDGDVASTPNGSRRIDHVFFSGPFRVRSAKVRRDAAGESDHYPVIVELEVVEPTPASPVAAPEAPSFGGLFGQGQAE